jgi:hypothetical protein
MLSWWEGVRGREQEVFLFEGFPETLHYPAVNKFPVNAVYVYKWVGLPHGKGGIVF